MTVELRLAAIIALLSSSAIRGTTAGKVCALRQHLEAAATGGAALDPHLRGALEDALAQWSSVDCQEPAVAIDYYPLPAAARMLH
jgi:hypothetical protein